MNQIANKDRRLHRLVLVSCFDLAVFVGRGILKFDSLESCQCSGEVDNFKEFDSGGSIAVNQSGTTMECAAHRLAHVFCKIRASDDFPKPA
jgi:hypothetical protein